MQTVVKISGMRCQSCVQGLMEAFRSHPEIISAKISLEPPIGVIESERPISIASLRAIADAAGEYQLEEREDGVAPNAPCDRASLGGHVLATSFDRQLALLGMQPDRMEKWLVELGLMDGRLHGRVLCRVCLF